VNLLLEKYHHITGDTNPNDLNVLAEIRQGIRQQDGFTDVHHHLPRLREAARGNVLEIGVRYGISTTALLLGVETHGGHVWSVDIDPCPVFMGHPQWTFLNQDSVKDSRHLLAILPAQLDLCFIDGDHSYEAVLSDLENYGRRAKIVMVHDANTVQNPQVFKAVMNYWKQEGCPQIRCDFSTESNGLAILS
jgi:hypothetical protein